MDVVKLIRDDSPTFGAKKVSVRLVEGLVELSQQALPFTASESNHTI